MRIERDHPLMERAAVKTVNVPNLKPHRLGRAVLICTALFGLVQTAGAVTAPIWALSDGSGSVVDIKAGLTSASSFNVNSLGGAQGTAALSQALSSGSSNVTFAVANTHTDKRGGQHIRFDQYYHRLKVVGAQVVVHTAANGVTTSVAGNYLANPTFSVRPALTPQSAIQSAVGNNIRGEIQDDPKLVIFGGRLAYHHVYVVQERGQIHHWNYYVDANRGELLAKFDNIQRVAPDCSAGNAETISGTGLAGEGSPSLTMQGWRNTGANYYINNCPPQAWGVYDTDALDWSQQAGSADWGTTDRDAVSAGFAFEATQDWISSELGWDSWDNNGTIARANVHEGSNLVNAYFDGVDFHFGDGDGVTADSLAVLDIAGHEIGHGITASSSDLIYMNEPGALNESFADIMGVGVEYNTQPDGRSYYPAGQPGASDWLMGEDSWIAEEALRDLRDPQRFGQPSCYKGTNWFTGTGDNGGVHFNSGVQNWVAYILAEGGSGTNDGNAYSISALGMDAVQEMANYVNTTQLVVSSDYQDARDAWSVAANALGHDVTQVEAAWEAAWCEGPPPTECPVGETQNFVYLEDFESGYGDWTMSGLWNAESQTNSCGVTAAPFPSPVNAAYYGDSSACNYDQGVNSGSLTMVNSVTVPADGFLSAMSFEVTECSGNCSWDDRKVEISSDSGTSWTVLGEGSVEGEWNLLKYDLSSYAGQQVLVRFTFDSIDDISNNYLGWMVDDVSIYTCGTAAAVPTEITVGLGENEGAGWLENIDPQSPHGLVDWMRIGWASYNAANGETRPVSCDVDGDGYMEIVSGLGTGGGGWLSVFNDHETTSHPQSWLRVDWDSYNSSNGESFPACGDLDGDGKAEIVVGLGLGGGGWIQVFDDASTGYTSLGWQRLDWGSYNATNGETHPTIGQFDNDSALELALGTASPDGNGWLQIIDDMATGFAHMSWRQVTWPSYNSAYGGTRPAACDLNGDGKDEIAVALDTGSQGWLQILDSASNFGGLGCTASSGGWVQSGRSGYAAYDGQTHAACADINGDGKDELMVGFGAYPADGGWVDFRGNCDTAVAHQDWGRIHWPAYNSANGETRPASNRQHFVGSTVEGLRSGGLLSGPNGRGGAVPFGTQNRPEISK